MSRTEQQARLRSVAPKVNDSEVAIPPSTIPPVIDEVVDEEAMFSEDEAAEDERESLVPSDYRIKKED